MTYTIDATRGLAYLSGNISPEIILRFRKAKKHAELIHLDYGHVNPSPYNAANPFETVPITYNYPDPRLTPPCQSPMYQPTAPMYPYMYHSQNAYIEQPPVASPYYHHPYYAPEMMYSPPPQLPTRDGVTGEQQCRIM